MAISGGCACGSVQYVISRDNLPKVYCCHCLDCQSRSGSVFCETAIIGVNEFEATGPLSTIARTLSGGTDFDVQTCGKCHATITGAWAGMPGKLLLRAGTLDDSSSFEPVAHIYASRKQKWVTLPDDVLVCKDAPSAEYFQVMGLA